jgi:hypothetical protein
MKNNGIKKCCKKGQKLTSGGQCITKPREAEKSAWKAYLDEGRNKLYYINQNTNKREEEMPEYLR